MPGRARAGLVCGHFLTKDHPCADRQPGEIAKIGHLGVGRIPEFRFDGLELRQNGSAVGVIRRNPVDGLKTGAVIGELLGFVAVDRFLLARRRQLGFFRGCFFVAELFQHIGNGFQFVRRNTHNGLLVI